MNNKTLEQQIVELTTNHEQRKEIISEGDCFDSGEIWEDFEKALEIITFLQQQNKLIKELQSDIEEALKQLRIAQEAKSFNEIGNGIFQARIALADIQLLKQVKL